MKGFGSGFYHILSFFNALKCIEHPVGKALKLIQVLQEEEKTGLSHLYNSESPLLIPSFCETAVLHGITGKARISHS